MPQGQRYEKRDKEARLRAERIRWKGSSRQMSKASANISERLRYLDDQASDLDRRLNRQKEKNLAWHRKWDDS